MKPITKSRRGRILRYRLGNGGICSRAGGEAGYASYLPLLSHASTYRPEDPSGREDRFLLGPIVPYHYAAAGSRHYPRKPNGNARTIDVRLALVLHPGMRCPAARARVSIAWRPSGMVSETRIMASSQLHVRWETEHRRQGVELLSMINVA